MDNNNPDSNTLDRIESDIIAITRTKYGSIRKLSELQAIETVLQQLQLQLAAQLDSDSKSRRRLITMRRIIRSQLVSIRKRITQVERMNTSKVNAQRTQRNSAQLMDALVESGLISTLVRDTRIARSEQTRIDKEHAQESRAALIPAIQKQFSDVGYNPLATSEERAEWERLRDINRHAIPGTDLSSQGDELTTMLKAAELERAKLDSNKLPTQEDINPLGSADEWIEKL